MLRNLRLMPYPCDLSCRLALEFALEERTWLEPVELREKERSRKVQGKCHIQKSIGLWRVHARSILLRALARIRPSRTHTRSRLQKAYARSRQFNVYGACHIHHLRASHIHHLWAGHKCHQLVDGGIGFAACGGLDLTAGCRTDRLRKTVELGGILGWLHLARQEELLEQYVEVPSAR